MKLLKYLLILQLLAFTFSCKTPEDILYFQNAKDLEKITVKNVTPILFNTGDLLSIYVSAVDMETALPFNISQGGRGASEEGGSSAPKYLIGYDGTIDFPVLGELKIVGLSRSQTIKLLKKRLSDYINNPSVSVKIENFKITVLGEVNNPGAYTIANEKVDIIQAIGLAGDLTIKGQRKNITVIRENDTLKTYHKIDLTSKELFNSPAFYLKQNDVVYVEPNASKIKTSRTNNNTLGIVLSMVGVIVSFLTLAR